ncbi:MAG TPA: hypothetical protein PLB22_11550, partial [Ottowia sp.]|nr:hypothetical protein [Ottowia sp.]
MANLSFSFKLFDMEDDGSDSMLIRVVPPGTIGNVRCIARDLDTGFQVEGWGKDEDAAKSAAIVVW